MRSARDAELLFVPEADTSLVADLDLRNQAGHLNLDQLLSHCLITFVWLLPVLPVPLLLDRKPTPRTEEGPQLSPLKCGRQRDPAASRVTADHHPAVADRHSGRGTGVGENVGAMRQRGPPRCQKRNVQ